MTSEAKNPEEYINSLPEDRKVYMEKLRNVIIKNLPKGFQEGMNYGMIGYYVPHSIYPKTRKLDMGKSCIRFKKFEEIPFDLIGELVTKISVDEWIATYELAFLKK